MRNEMTLDECWQQLEAESLGHLAVRADPGVEIFPVNYTVHDRAVYFRTAPGNKLVELTAHPLVAFEIDGHDGNTHWSVVIKGEATRLDDDAEITASGVLDLHTATATPKGNFVRIEAYSVTGRRFSLLDGLAEPLS